MPQFATYLYPQTLFSTQPMETLPHAGFSFPYFAKIRAGLEAALKHYPGLPVRRVDYSEFERVHTKQYLDALQVMASGEKPDFRPRLSIECTSFEHFIPGYCYALGGLYEAVDRIKQGVVQRAYCFSLGGHHAYADWGHGYCILHPMATAARYAQSQGFKNILIIDWDLHHGDGTQSIFAHDSSVYCISIHSIADLYMTLQRTLRDGTTTAAKAVGHCNIPLLDSMFDESFFEKMELTGDYYRANQSLDAFQTALETLPFTPDLIFIHSGYDSHIDDHGKRITNWTNDDYQRLTTCVLDIAKDIPVISVHGGGYTHEVAISAAVSHLEALFNS